MSGETKGAVSGWTIDTFKAYHDAITEWRDRFDKERDRRYSEVALEREKALKIKEQADRDALELDRQIRSYKDEKGNDLREQLSDEREGYASKQDLAASINRIEAILAPVLVYVAQQQGSGKGMRDMWGWISAGVIFLIAVIGFLSNRI